MESWWRRRGLSGLMLLVLLVVGVLGFVAGRHGGGGGGAPAPGAMRVASVGALSLEYPREWRVVSADPGIPGVKLEHVLVLAPGGDPAHAGLIAGERPGDEANPLPDALLDALRATPDTQVVDLLSVQAYRYANLHIAGYAGTVVLDSIPGPGAPTTILGCYASSATSVYLHRCEQIVAGASLSGQPQYDLTPDAGYATALSSQLDALDRQRLALRQEINGHATPASASAAAARLASLFGGAATALTLLSVPPPAIRAQAVLVEALGRARDAYTALSSAAGAEGEAAYLNARAQVAQAERSVNAALDSIALLGYGRS